MINLSKGSYIVGIWFLEWTGAANLAGGDWLACVYRNADSQVTYATCRYRFPSPVPAFVKDLRKWMTDEYQITDPDEQHIAMVRNWIAEVKARPASKDLVFTRTEELIIRGGTEEFFAASEGCDWLRRGSPAQFQRGEIE